MGNWTHVYNSHNLSKEVAEKNFEVALVDRVNASKRT